MKCIRAALCIAAALSAGGCRRDRGVHLFLDQTYPEKLSAWRLFVAGPPGSLKPNDRVVPYAVHTALFSDHADKERMLWMPPGTKASVLSNGSIDFPVGTILVKTFSFPENGRERRIETRLLVHRRDTWVGIPYVWNREQTDAALAVTGDVTTVAYHGRTIEYAIPNVNQCRSCHDQAGDTLPLGPTTRNLDPSTLLYLGVKAPPPPPDTPEVRAREYLDTNCAHCHNPQGSAMAIPIDLRFHQTDPRQLGVAQPVTKPVEGAPDLKLIIDPGRPETSALLRRMASTGKSGMPTIGHSTVDADGVQLVSDWIRSMKRSR